MAYSENERVNRVGCGVDRYAPRTNGCHPQGKGLGAGSKKLDISCVGFYGVRPAKPEITRSIRVALSLSDTRSNERRR